MMKTISIAAVLALGLPLAAAAPARAQGTAAQREACSGDAFRLCASSMPSADKVAACLRREKDQLSPACRGVFEAAEGGARQNGTAAKETAKPERPQKAETARPAGTPPASQAAAPPAPRRPVAKASTQPAARTQVAESGDSLKRPAVGPSRARQASQGRRTTIAAHRHQGRRGGSDFAQADYWMRRVTGVSLGPLAGMVPN